MLPCLQGLFHLCRSTDLIIPNSQMLLRTFCSDNGKQDLTATFAWCSTRYCSWNNSFAMFNLWKHGFFINITSILCWRQINISPQVAFIYMKGKKKFEMIYFPDLFRWTYSLQKFQRIFENNNSNFVSNNTLSHPFHP